MKTTLPILILGFCLLSMISYSQNWTKSWEKLIGTGKMDCFTDVIEDKSTGYTVLGSTPGINGSQDFWLVRFNENGDTLWTRTFGTRFQDHPKKMVQLGDGSYIMMGAVCDPDLEKFILFKTDDKGNELWQKIFENEYVHQAEDIIIDDNEILVAGARGKDMKTMKQWMLKLNTDGDVIWEKTYQENLIGCVKSIKKLPVGGYSMASQIDETKNNRHITIHRLNKNAELMWSSKIESSGMKVWPECLCCSPDSCFMLVGWQGMCIGDINAENPVFDYDLIISKIDCKGKVLWKKNVDKEGSEGGHAVTIRPDGNFIVAGIKETSFLGKIGPWLLLIDPDGNILHEELLQLHFANDRAIKVLNCSDGGVVVIGPGIQENSNTRSDGWITKFSIL